MLPLSGANCGNDFTPFCVNELGLQGKRKQCLCIVVGSGSNHIGLVSVWDMCNRLWIGM